MKDICDEEREKTGWSTQSAFFRICLIIHNYSEPHSQNRIFDASILLMWLPRHIKLLFCLNASIHRKQFCMALNSYQKKSIRWRTLFCTGKLPTGLEPVIYWLRINRSTNWATEALWTVLYYDTRGGGFCQEKNESSRVMLQKPYVTKALRCNGFVAGPVSLQLTGHPFAKPHVPCVVALQLCFAHERASTSSCWSVKFLCKHEICRLSLLRQLAWQVNCWNTNFLENRKISHCQRKKYHV